MKKIFFVFKICIFVLIFLSRLESSVKDSLKNITFGKTAQIVKNSNSPELYIGAETIQKNATARQKKYCLTRATLQRKTGASSAVKLEGLAQIGTVVINQEQQTDSPFYNNKITHLSMAGFFPVATVDTKNIYLVTKPDDGTRIITNNDGNTIKISINDSQGIGHAAQEVVALAGGVDKNSKPHVFAAVSSEKKSWDSGAVDAAMRGIALLKPNIANDTLDVYDATDFDTKKIGQTNKAAKLNFLATKNDVPVADRGPVALKAADAQPLAAVHGQITTAECGAGVDMFWHNDLQRLYIGMNHVKRDDYTLEGGILGLAMGRIDDAGKIALQSVVNDVKREFLYDAADVTKKNVNNRVLGFYYDGVNNKPQAANDGNSPVSVSIKQICNMRTSTNKDYLIVNSAIGGKPTPFVKGVFALPLQGIKKIDGTDVPISEIGTISKVDPATGKATFDGGPTNFDEMPSAFKDAVSVSSFNPENISNIFVSGDTVYTCMDSKFQNSQAGVFSSTALFDENGSIRSWTPARRCSGSIQEVLGGCIDKKTGELYTVTNEKDNERGGDSNTVRITQWGKSASVDASENLSTVLARLFPLANGGVHNFQVFDQFSTGFRPNSMAMAVVTGVDKVVLIQIGFYDGGQFCVTKKFIDTPGPTQNVFVFDTATHAALAAIAPLTCAEISRFSGISDSGWLFVGGYRGVAVLRNITAANLPADNNANVSTSAIGRGWPSNNIMANGALRQLQYRDGLDQNRFPAGDNWRFLALKSVAVPTGFSAVLKMIAWRNRLYVVTLGGVYYFSMTYAKFNDAPAPLGDAIVPGLPSGTLIADMILLSPDNNVANHRGIIATSNGLFVTNFTQTILVQKTGDIALSLAALGDSRQIPKTVNFRVLGATINTKYDQLFNFDLPDAAAVLNDLVKKAKNSKFDLNNNRQTIVDDGTFVYATKQKKDNSTNLLTLYPRGTKDAIDITELLDINLNTNFLIGNVVRDTSSGMVVVSGDWGVRVNE